MATLQEQILQLLTEKPGLTDREITNALREVSAPQQPVNIVARSLASKGLVDRRKRKDRRIGILQAKRSRQRSLAGRD